MRPSGKFSVSGRARRDLLEIRDFSSRNFGAELTEALFGRLISAFEQLARLPHSGSAIHAPIKLNLRKLVSQYMIAYRVRRADVLIVRVLHAKRDIPPHLRSAP